MDINKLCEQLIAAWNTNDTEHRRKILNSVLEPQFVYCDARNSEMIHGLAAMNDFLELSHRRTHNLLIQRRALDYHHSVFRLFWRIENPDSLNLSRGILVGWLSPGMRIYQLAKFFDQPAA